MLVAVPKESCEAVLVQEVFALGPDEAWTIDVSALAARGAIGVAFIAGPDTTGVVACGADLPTSVRRMGVRQRVCA